MSLGKTNDDLVKEYMNIKDNVIALLTHADGTYDIHTTHNLITTDGSNYYAQLINGDTPTNTFNSCYLGNNNTDTVGTGDSFVDFDAGDFQNNSPKDSEKLITSTGLNNLDADNTGKGPFIFTWKFIWEGVDFDTQGNDNVFSGVISVASATQTGDQDLLNHFVFAIPFEKLATSTLTLWINHTFADNT